MKQIRLIRDFWEITGEEDLGRRNGDLGDHLAALRRHRCRKEIAVVVTEGEIREDHCDLLARVRADPRRHRDDLAADIGDIGLQDPAVQHAGGDLIALGTDQICYLQLAHTGGRANDVMAEQSAHEHIATGLHSQLFNQFRAALWIGRFTFEHDLYPATVDAATVIDRLQRSLRGALIPAATRGTDAGAVRLEADLDRRCLSGKMARQNGGEKSRRPSPSALSGVRRCETNLSSLSLHCVRNLKWANLIAIGLDGPKMRSHFIRFWRWTTARNQTSCKAP